MQPTWSNSIFWLPWLIFFQYVHIINIILIFFSVAFYKRAQILIADIWACFEGQGLGYFYDINYLTMFADYR